MLSVLCAGAIPGVFYGNGPIQAVYPGLVPEKGGSDMRKRGNVFVQLGERVRRRPKTFTCTIGKRATRAMEGRVVFVHSEGRFHVVEFQTMGGPLRESFLGVLK